uniref:diguanylate cyclase n=1 Tax=Candidatus Caldatribacterium saccharofermentans TaxID=1454753 RepID=A0A7V4TIC5_9BACT
MANRLRKAISAFLALRHRNPGMFSLFIILGEALLWFLAFPVLPPVRWDPVYVVVTLGLFIPVFFSFPLVSLLKHWPGELGWWLLVSGVATESFDQFTEEPVLFGAVLPAACAILGWSLLAWAIHRSFRLAREQSFRDPLTGLYNRAYFEREVPRLLERVYREGTPFTLALLDCDGLKAINDCYSHGFGDLALCLLGESLREGSRKSDVLIRYGGDEFLLLLPGASREEAEKVIARVQKILDEKTKFLPCPFGFSAGVISWTPGEEPLDLAALFAQVDAAMYAAKRERKPSLE